MGPKRKQMSPAKMVEKPLATPDDDEGYDYSEPQACWTCSGRGWVIDCIDDLCHGQDECIHGDGETTCPDCGGTGDA